MYLSLTSKHKSYFIVKNGIKKLTAVSVGLALSTLTASVVADNIKSFKFAKKSVFTSSQSDDPGCNRRLARGNKEAIRFIRRLDIAPLPGALCDQLIELVNRPHSSLPLAVFSEADDPSLLSSYYLLNTSEFEPNPFTAPIAGINDSALPTGSNSANGGLPTIGTVRLVF